MKLSYDNPMVNSCSNIPPIVAINYQWKVFWGGRAELVTKTKYLVTSDSKNSHLDKDITMKKAGFR